MIEIVKELRVKIDALHQITQDSLGKTRNVSIAITNFETAKMWLGRVLKELDNANPYPESKDPKSTVIEPTADKATEGNFPYDLTEFNTLDTIGKIKWIRNEAQVIEDQMREDIHEQEVQDSMFTVLNFAESLQSLILGSMYLGQELGVIKAASDNTTEEKNISATPSAEQAPEVK